jgi:hypothetical protein
MREPITRESRQLRLVRSGRRMLDLRGARSEATAGVGAGGSMVAAAEVGCRGSLSDSELLKVPGFV